MNIEQAISQEELTQYLDGSLSTVQKTRVEEALANDPFLADAIEGLTAHGDPALLAHVTHQINNQLRYQVAQRRKTRRGKKRDLPNYKVWISILVLLSLIVIAYFAIVKLT